ncbi:MAG: hypothetical protein RL168_603 [Bacteroidota bacterium]|jgi:nicotinamide mononucleotide transporter
MDRVEIASAGFNLLYALGIAWKKAWAWPAGFLGCTLAIWLFWDLNLYLEAVLNAIYAALALFGWWSWKRSSTLASILQWDRARLVSALGIGFLFVLPLGYGFEAWSNHPRPFADAFIFSFSVLATWMQAERIYQNWYLWIGINLAMVFLCTDRGLLIYAGYSAVMLFLSFYGLQNWRSKLEA